MLRLVPLGGLGEIGLNSMVIEVGAKRLVIDAGLMFPTARMPGVDVVLPDFQHLRDHASTAQAVLLTHGHEDHIGALGALLRQVPLPVYGTPFTLALAEHRLSEDGLTADLRELKPGRKVDLGDGVSVEPVRVCHSIVDGVGLVLRSPFGTLVHTGDFKLDPDAPEALRTDLPRLAQIGEEGVACLLSDSTNVESPAHSGSEQQVAKELHRLVRDAQGRAVVAMFASNVPRLQAVVEAASATGRRLVLHGRSLLRNTEIALRLSLLKVPQGLVATLDEAASMPRERVVVLTTGAQAEPRSGLVQMCEPTFALPVGPGDRVVMSSRPIPGNERAVGELVDRLLRAGAEVSYARIDGGVHVSGHGAAPELTQMIEVLRPRAFVPIHGERKHLWRHLALARQAGVPADGLVLAEDGDVVAVEPDGAKVVGRAPVGRVFRDRHASSEVAPEALRMREQLAELGAWTAVVVVRDGALAAPPRLFARGASALEETVLPQVTQELERELLGLSPATWGSDAALEDEVHRLVRRAIRDRTGKRAQVLPCVVRL